MTNREVAIRIEELFDAQPNSGALHDALEKLQDELLGDPTGHERQAITYERYAGYWAGSGRPEAIEQAAHFRKMAANERAKRNPA